MNGSTRNTMIAARLHQFGARLSLDEVDIPDPGPFEVRVAIRACNIVPNLANVLSDQWQRLFPHLLRPKLPAIFGLDATGIIDAIGKSVTALEPGQRVYVNPARGCGDCRHCRNGEDLFCPSAIFQGYFARTSLGLSLFDRYPTGGLAEYLVAPVSAIVTLPETVSFEEGARFGYLGTGYSALLKAGTGAGKSVLINAIGGTLGLGTALLGLAMGVTRIFGTGRNPDLLDRVKKISPERIEVLSVDNGTKIGDWVRDHTNGYGVDSVIDALPPGAPVEAAMEALDSLRVGGSAVDIGGVNGPQTFPGYWIKARNATIIGSRWFTTAEGQAMAEMAGAGILNLSVLDHHRFELKNVNDAISALNDDVRGFDNFVVSPH